MTVGPLLFEQEKRAAGSLLPPHVPAREFGLLELHRNIAGRIAAALDEEEALPGVLADLRGRGLRRVVVADNGSVDRTAAVARAGGAEVVGCPRRGYGSACLAGLRFMAADPPEVVVFTDAEVIQPDLVGESDFLHQVGNALHGADRGSGHGVRVGRHKTVDADLHAGLGSQLGPQCN